ISGINAGAVIVDDNRNKLSLARRGNSNAFGVTLGVGDKVANATLHRHRAYADIEISPGLHSKLGAVSFGRGPEILEHRSNVDPGGRFAGVPARESEISLQHLPHLINICL